MNPQITVRCMLMVAIACLPSMAQAQQATIYRCHAVKGGVLIFQDKPCNQVAGTQEAQKGSAGDIIPNAPPAPESDGPPLAERYENYLDKQSERRASEAAATPAAAPTPTYEAEATRNYGYPGVSAVGTADGYAGYNEGAYPYPVYPPYFNRDHPRNNNQNYGGSNSNSGSAVPPYNNGPQPLPKPLPLPGSSFPARPQRVAPAPSPPGTVVARDPNR